MLACRKYEIFDLEKSESKIILQIFCLLDCINNAVVKVIYKF